MSAPLPHRGQGAADILRTAQRLADDVLFPAALTTDAAVTPNPGGPTPPAVIRMHASFALGVIRRCCRLLGPTPLDEELDRLRAGLDQLDPDSIESSRGVAGELAVRAAAALVVTTGSRSLLLDAQAQRLAREALFVLVYALRPGSRAAALTQLGAL